MAQGPRDEGSVRMPTEKEAVILGMMIGRPQQERYAWDLVRESDGEIGENSVYVIVTRMVARGLLEDRVETKAEAHRGARRRLYKLTGLGQRSYAAWVTSRAMIMGHEAVEGVEGVLAGVTLAGSNGPPTKK